jgi:hypothetical protein
VCRASEVPQVMAGEGTMAEAEAALQQDPEAEGVAVLHKADRTLAGAVMRSQRRYLCVLHLCL